MRWGLLVVVLFVAPAAAAGGDAASGADASDQYAYALPVELGTFSGSLDWGDSSDWYRLDVPVGFALRIRLTPHEGDLDLAAYDATEEIILHSDAPGTTPEELDLSGTTGDVRFVVYPSSGRGAYTVDLALVHLPDHAVTDVRDAGDAVEFVVANILGDARAVRVRVWTEQPGAIRELARMWVAPPQGGAQTFSVPWDARGQVGHVLVHAVIEDPEGDRSNDAASVATWRVAAVPVGVDVLNGPRVLGVGWRYAGGDLCFSGGVCVGLP